MKLKTDFYEVDILGYFNWSGAIRVDIKLNSYGELKEFLKFVFEHGEQNGLFDFEIGEEAFRGHCGMYYYDRTYNVRLIMISTSDEAYARERHSTTLLFENLEKVLDGQRKAIVEITNLLCEREIDRLEILRNVPEIEYGQGLRHLVEDLPDWLKKSGERLEDLERNRPDLKA